MDSTTIDEESTSLTPKVTHQLQEKSSFCSSSCSSSHHHRTTSMLHYNREKRIRLIRLAPVYYVTWVLLILLTSLIPPYLYYFIPEPDCWHARQTHITISMILAITTCLVSFILLIIQCMTRVKTTLCRRNFCRFSFILFFLFFIFNFAIAIYFFNMFSCYFDQSTPDEELSDDDDWFMNLTIRYDLKMVAVIHLICSLLAFFTGIGFAIIRNNFKYVLRVDIN